MELSAGGILVFHVAGVRYGLVLEQVVEVVRAVALTVLPKAPPIIEGIINLRGAVIPVLDIRSRFRLRPKPVELADRLIIARAGLRLVAVRVDEVEELMRPAKDDLIDAGAILPEAEYVAGVIKRDDGLILIHNLERFLSAAEAEQVDTALEALEPSA